MINYVLGVFIVALLGLAVLKLLRRRKKGEGCAGCTACCSRNIPNDCVVKSHSKIS